MHSTASLFAMLVLAGRCTPAQGQAAAAYLDPTVEPDGVREVLRAVAAALGATTGSVPVSCPACDGRGFTRRGPLLDGAGKVAFCDECEGHGTRRVDLDLEAVPT